jgi:hypothetical protein
MPPGHSKETETIMASTTPLNYDTTATAAEIIKDNRVLLGLPVELPIMADIGRLVTAAAALLHTIDHREIRVAALNCGLPIYERAADLKDAIAACQPKAPVFDADLPIEYVLTTTGRQAIHEPYEDRDLVWERLPSGEFAWLKASA